MLRTLPLLLAALRASFSAAIDVSVCRDATYDIDVDASTLCAGDGAFPAGTNCPKTGNVAVAECYSYLPSYVDGRCVAPEDAVCQLVTDDTWGCVLPSIGCDDVVLGAPHCPTWDYFGNLTEHKPFDGHEHIEYDARWFVQTTPLRDLWGCIAEEPTPAPTTPRATPAATARARIATPAPTRTQRRTPAPTPAPTVRTKILPVPTPALTTRTKIPIPTPAVTTRTKTPVSTPGASKTQVVVPTGAPTTTTTTKTPVATETPVLPWTETPVSTPVPTWTEAPWPTVSNWTNSSASGNASIASDDGEVKVGDVDPRDGGSTFSNSTELARKASSAAVSLSSAEDKHSTGLGASVIVAVAVAAAVAALVAVAAAYARNKTQMLQQQNEAEGARRGSTEYEMVVTPPHALVTPQCMTSPRL